ncbi:MULTISPECIES: lycopene cyclase domain-containing protein [Haloferax]|uniref:Lycopene cyclase domain-containing protein n=2 Tax=Haloferax TaxID=2251 RepID=A0A6G1YYR3_9EURY|nr:MULTISPECIES: lycopene cyclase domain-containing protein [Haloferax]KAB1186661.1 lycopene cyclase domain-containing protein [Haloferax sp. CBA1149]MRW79281.1 lycopene cyclase domain-containing protein [Haloferax marinisediminis]
MSIARHDTGAKAALGALASQVHPVFMLPPVAASWFGAILAGEFALLPGTLYAAAVFFGVYTAHVKDGYVDFYQRGEDDDHPLTRRGCQLCLVGATLGFVLSTGALVGLVGAGVLVFTIPGWLLGYFHAPQLDTNPVTTTLGYPLGIALAILGGYYVQTGTLTATPIAFAGVLLFVLAGIKIIDDAKDYDYDRSIDKRTVAVVLGTDGAYRLAHVLIGAGLFFVVAGAITGTFPPFAAVAAVPFALVVVIARNAPPKLATMMLVRGSYVFLALLVIAVAFRPLSGISLPDIGVLGPYTYLATEVLFGSVAAVLLVRAGRDAIRRTARTVAVVYPIAYVWDWYTLEVGVFSIPLRTGIELLGIPLEEHIFMLVVPAFVLAIHETFERGRSSESPATRRG